MKFFTLKFSLVAKNIKIIKSISGNFFYNIGSLKALV